MLKLNRLFKLSKTNLGGIGKVEFHTSSPLLAGHSKWANIRHDKAKNDAKRSKEATMIANKIEVSVRLGGVDSNAQLETLVEKAKKLNVTKKIIELAIKRGSGEISSDGPVVHDVQYEFMGPGGVAFIVNASTDNKARTVSIVKSALKEFHALLSPCLYMFARKGEVIFESEDSLDEVMDFAIEIGAEDVEEFVDEEGDYDSTKLFRVITDPTELFSISNVLSKKYQLKDSKLTYLAGESEVPFPEEYIKGFKKCVDILDGNGDVSEYWTNISS